VLRELLPLVILFLPSLAEGWVREGKMSADELAELRELLADPAKRRRLVMAVRQVGARLDTIVDLAGAVFEQAGEPTHPAWTEVELRYDEASGTFELVGDEAPALREGDVPADGAE